MNTLSIEYRPIATLRPYQGNARTHSKKQIRQLADSIREFGWTNPVLIDAVGQIIAGHGRVEAAKLIGLKAVPTLRIDHLTDAQKRAYLLADNKLALNAGWDRELLVLELKGLTDLDFDLGVIGFEASELDLLFEDLADSERDPGDDIPELDQGKAAVTHTGDLWLLGRHRLLCGDATNAEAYARLMNGAAATMVFTDPPYNVPINGFVSGLGKTRHREFVMAAGEMSETEFTCFLERVFGNLVHHTINGAIAFVCMDWRHLTETLSAGRTTFSELKNIIVWAKTHAGMGAFYRSQHELILAFKNGSATHVNNFELGQHGRHRSNVWTYASVNTFRVGREDELKLHPTVKPLALVADAIKDCARRGDAVLDPFVGSGTTILAAEKTGRRAYAMELDPKYVDVALRRWQAFTGRDAVLAGTDRSFEEIGVTGNGPPETRSTPNAARTAVGPPAVRAPLNRKKRSRRH